MIARLANVLYWTGCGVAGLFGLLAAAILIFATGQEKMNALMVGAVAVVAWLIGRACRYVLAGR